MWGDCRSLAKCISHFIKVSSLSSRQVAADVRRLSLKSKPQTLIVLGVFPSRLTDLDSNKKEVFIWKWGQFQFILENYASQDLVAALWMRRLLKSCWESKTDRKLILGNELFSIWEHGSLLQRKQIKKATTLNESCWWAVGRACLTDAIFWHLYSNTERRGNPNTITLMNENAGPYIKQ